jgi:hypothetical protein
MSAGCCPRGLDGDEVQIVGHQHHLLGREVPEEGAGRYLGGLRDLFDGGVGVPGFLDQPHGFTPDGLASLDLLAIPQTENLITDPHGAIVSMSMC